MPMQEKQRGEEMAVKGQENLIPLNERPKDVQRKIQQMGVEASVERRKELRLAKDIARAMLDAKAKDKKAVEKIRELGIDEEDATNMAAIMATHIEKSKKGDAKSTELVLGLVGEKPSDKLDITNVELVGETKEDAMKAFLEKIEGKKKDERSTEESS